MCWSSKPFPSWLCLLAHVYMHTQRPLHAIFLFIFISNCNPYTLFSSLGAHSEPLVKCSPAPPWRVVCQGHGLFLTDTQPRGGGRWQSSTGPPLTSGILGVAPEAHSAHRWREIGELAECMCADTHRAKISQKSESGFSFQWRQGQDRPLWVPYSRLDAGFSQPWNACLFSTGETDLW